MRASAAGVRRTELDAGEGFRRDRTRPRHEQLVRRAAAAARDRRAAAGSARPCPSRTVDRRGHVAVQADQSLVRQIVGQRGGRARRTAAGSTRCRRARRRCDTSLYSGDLDGSPSNTSRNRWRKRVRPASSSGNSRAGSNRTSRHRVDACAGCRRRKCGSIRSRRRTGRCGRAAGCPSGTGRSSPPRTQNSPGETTCVTC